MTARDAERLSVWPEVTFGSLYAVPSRNGVYKTGDFHGRGCRVVNMGEMFGYDFISDQEMNLVSLNASELAASTLQDGDLLFGRRSIVEAGAGKCSLVVSPGSPLAFESSIIRARLRNDVTVPLFFYYFFQSPPGRRRVRGIVSGTNVKGIRGSELRDLAVPLPSPPEQRAIAVALSDVDALLAALDRLIAKKRDLKQAAMQQLLTGKTRLPGFTGDWDTKRLGELATFHKGKGLPKSALRPDGSEQCVHYGELFTQYGCTIRDTVSRTIPFAGAFRSLSNDVLMPTSDVTPRGLAKASCVVTDGVVLGGDILVIRTEPKEVSGTFLSYVIRLDEDQVLRLVSGTTVFHLYGADMKKFAFRLPLRAEQDAIVEVLADMEGEIAALQQRRDKTNLLKQGMMQELLTGRTRLV